MVAHAGDTSNATPRAASHPAASGVTIAAFRGCGLPRLRALVESLLLSMADRAPSPSPLDPLSIQWIDGLSDSPGLSDPSAVASSLIGRRVVLLCRDPREAVVENYRRYRVERRSIGSSLDDLLCARPAGVGPLTPETRLGLRACVDFMSALVRSQHCFDDFLVIHEQDADADPWAIVRQLAEFLGLQPTAEDLIGAARRAGPLARSLARSLPAPLPGAATRAGRAPDGHPAPLRERPFPLALSAGQRVFADDLIAEHLHPALDRYKAATRHSASRAA